jgi:hypothetical protein
VPPKEEVGKPKELVLLEALKLVFSLLIGYEIEEVLQHGNKM